MTISHLLICKNSSKLITKNILCGTTIGATLPLLLNYYLKHE